MATKFSPASFLSSGFGLYLFGVVYFVGALSGRADLLVYEGFDYPAGELVGQTGGKGWNDPWHGYPGARGSVAEKSLVSNPPVATKGGHLETVDADTPMMRTLEHPLFGEAGVTWLSILLRNDSGETAQTYSYFTLGTSGDKKEAEISIGKDYNATNWGVSCGDQKQNLSVAADTSVVLIVLRIEHSDTGGSDSVQVFVNPPLDSEPTVNEIKFGALTLKPMDLVSIRSGTGRKIFSYDEIRVGTTFADVVPPGPASDPK